MAKAGVAVAASTRAKPNALAPIGIMLFSFIKGSSSSSERTKKSFSRPAIVTSKSHGPIARNHDSRPNAPAPSLPLRFPYPGARQAALTDIRWKFDVRSPKTSVGRLLKFSPSAVVVQPNRLCTITCQMAGDNKTVDFLQPELAKMGNLEESRHLTREPSDFNGFGGPERTIAAAQRGSTVSIHL